MQTVQPGEKSWRQLVSAYGVFKSCAVASLLVLLAACGGRPIPGAPALNALTERTCEADVPPDAGPWHILRLFDCESQSLYIPYELWSGATWDGVRRTQCMHPVDNTGIYNVMLLSRITGPHERVNPVTGKTEQYWKRRHLSDGHEQFYVCNDNGVALTWDSEWQLNRSGAGCDFPAGPGWAPSKKRRCGRYTVQITDIEINDANELVELEFRWWRGMVLDYAYRYRRNHGLTIAHKLPRDTPSAIKPKEEIFSR